MNSANIHVIHGCENVSNKDGSFDCQKNDKYLTKPLCRDFPIGSGFLCKKTELISAKYDLLNKT